MKIGADEYRAMVGREGPGSPWAADLLLSFLSGGAICAAGQGITDLWRLAGVSPDLSGVLMTVTLIALASLATGLGWYDKAARFCGAGTLVPVTGFSNSMTACAMEFKQEGLVTGLGARMFLIAGPVLVYGLAASVVYGLVLLLL